MLRRAYLFWLLPLGLFACEPDDFTTADADANSDGASDAVTDAPDVPRADKVDLLFVIDNSASMADKQEYLAKSLPSFVTAVTALTGDIHVGIVSSSLGPGGSPDICTGTSPPPPAGQRHDNDQGRLINRTKPPSGPSEPTIAKATAKNGTGGGFLAWLPSGTPAPNVGTYADVPSFGADFQALVVGTGEYGCGLEAPLESFYHFLVQPDPWVQIQRSGTINTLVGVDKIVLQQRKDFLRPDSLVVVVVVTDEADSWNDPLAYGGVGWAWRSIQFPGAPTPQILPRPTAACASDPFSPSCLPCIPSLKLPNDAGVLTDPGCAGGYYGPSEDGINARFRDDVSLLKRYGWDPMFPLSRYVDGLKSPKVPDRTGEHDTPDGGPQPFAHGYKATKNCTNPLFAASLPGSELDELCNLPQGNRPPENVIYGILGGVPSTLVGAKGGSLGPADWKAIVGTDPAKGDLSGIDPHMLESQAARPGLPPTSAADTADPVHGREWETSQSLSLVDLQYACTFPLIGEKDCSSSTTCDCGSWVKAGGPPLCKQGNNLFQVRGKAYPTIRELRLARDLGPSGVVGSICPTSSNANDADFGYAPFLRALIAKMKGRLK